MTFRERIFPTWTRLTNLNRRAMRRNSDRGRLMQTGTFICGALGLDTDLSFVYQLFALMICILIFARLSLRLHVPDVEVRRQLPRYATAGEAFEYAITVTNKGEEAERDLGLIDNPRVIPPDLNQFLGMREPGEETRNAYDRWIGFHRFVWLQKFNTGISIKPAKVPDIETGGQQQTIVSATPLRRGYVNFESITLLHPDPLGLNYGVIETTAREQMMVLPARYELSRTFSMPGGRHFQPGGVNSTWSIGESDEFASLREYRDGDPIRKIHWASTAKRNKPVVKEFQDEFFVRQALVVDNFRQGDQAIDSPVFEEIVCLSATLLTAMDSKDGLIDLTIMNPGPEVITAGRGFTQTAEQLEALAVLEQSAADTSLLQELLTERARLLSGCLFVFSTFDSSRQLLLESIEAKGVSTTVFVITKNAALPIRNDFHILDPEKMQAGLSAL